MRWERRADLQQWHWHWQRKWQGKICKAFQDCRGMVKRVGDWLYARVRKKWVKGGSEVHHWVDREDGEAFPWATGQRQTGNSKRSHFLFGRAARYNAGGPVAFEFQINNKSFFRVSIPPWNTWDILILKAFHLFPCIRSVFLNFAADWNHLGEILSFQTAPCNTWDILSKMICCLSEIQIYLCV